MSNCNNDLLLDLTGTWKSQNGTPVVNNQKVKITGYDNNKI